MLPATGTTDAILHRLCCWKAWVSHPAKPARVLGNINSSSSFSSEGHKKRKKKIITMPKQCFLSEGTSVSLPKQQTWEKHIQDTRKRGQEKCTGYIMTDRLLLCLPMSHLKTVSPWSQYMQQKVATDVVKFGI